MSRQTRKADIYIQPGGLSTAPAYVASAANAVVGAPSGGGVTFESVFAGDDPIGSRQTANPSRVTAQIDVRDEVAQALEAAIERANCLPSWLIYKGCEPGSKKNWTDLFIMVNGGLTTPTFSGNIVDGTSGDEIGQTQMRRATIDALTMVRMKPLAPSLITGTALSAAWNHIIPLDPNGNCNPTCGGYSNGTDHLIAVGDPITPATIPNIGYSANGGTSWTVQTIAAVANGAAEQVCVVGDFVLVAVSGTNGGIYRAPLADVKTGTAVFVLCTGITGGNVYNSIIALNASTAIAVGASGRIAVSRNGGLSFSLLTNSSSENLNSVSAGVNPNLVWAGGANGALLRIRGLFAVEVITGSGASTDDILTVAVPRTRPTAVYIGTDAGDIFRSTNAEDAVLSWTELDFDKPAGGSTIADIQFTGALGAVMSIIQTNSSTDSRVLIDPTGGNAGDHMFAVGTFNNPTNNGFNSIAAINPKHFVVAGEVGTTYGVLAVITATS